MYFSVLIPVYNQLGKMDGCIKSLREQTFTDFETIFVDDGSTDGSGKFLDDLCASNNRFSVFHHEKNGSLTTARFTGMQHAKGSHIVFLDSDDALETSALAELKASFDDGAPDIIRFGTVMEPMGVELMPIETDDFLRTYMEGKFPPAIWKNAYSADVIHKTLEACEPFYCNMGEDSFFSGVFFSLAKTVKRLPKVLYRYDASSGMSQTNAVSTMAKLQRDYDSVQASAENLLKFIKKYNSDYTTLAEKAVRHMQRYILCQNMLYAKDCLDMVSYLEFFKEKGHTSVYEFGCKELIPYKVKFDMKRTDERFADIELEDLFTFLPEKD